MEEQIYKRQILKLSVAKRVIDEQQVDRHYKQNDLGQLYTENIVQQNVTSPEKCLPKDEVLAELLEKHPDVIFRYQDHESLLMNKTDDILTQVEREKAWTEYELEAKKKTNEMQRYRNLFRK